MSTNGGVMSAETALAEYRAVGVEPLGEFSLDQADKWLAVLGATALNTDQVLTAAWLEIERGRQEYSMADKARRNQQLADTKQRKSGRSIAGAGTRIPKHRGVTFMRHATDALLAVVDDEAASLHTQAQLHLLLGALPLIENMVALEGTEQGSKQVRMEAIPGYRIAQAGAVDFMHELAGQRSLGPDEQIFVRILDFLVVGNGLINSQIIVLPAPPRCYEGLALEDSWHCTIWDARRGKGHHMLTALSPTTNVSRVFPALQEGGVQGWDDPDENLRLLREIRTVMLDKDHVVPIDSRLHAGAVSIAGLFSTLVKRRHVSVLNLPDLVRYADRPGEALEVEIDLPPITYPEIKIEDLRAMDVFAWYAQQSNGRRLDTSESSRLSEATKPYNNPIQFDRLSWEDQLMLNRMRVDSALGYASKFLSPARDLLDRANKSLRAIQGQARNVGFTGVMFEAALDEMRVKFIEQVLGINDTEISRDDILNDLLELLFEMNFEKPKLKFKDQLPIINDLSRAVLNAILVMRFSGDEKLIALPAYGRELGDAEHPGWNVSVWSIDGDGLVDIAQMRKLRVSEGVSHAMHQGDIGVIPADSIKKTASVADFIKTFGHLTKEDERSARAANVINKWRSQLQPIIQRALELAV